MQSDVRISAGQDAGFLDGQLLESGLYGLAIRKAFREADEDRVVPGFRLHEASVEGREFTVPEVVTEELETLAGARFDEGRHQTAVDGLPGLLLADQGAQAGSVGTLLLAAHSQTASLQQIQGLFQVIQLLLDDG